MVRKSRLEGSLKNLAMNEYTYKLRREVIKLIYEANHLLRLPRVTVRITENDVYGKGSRILGQARLGDNIVWISKDAVENKNLRTIVFHELVHGVFGVGHDESCPLMKAHYSSLDKDLVHERFLYWANQSGYKG